MALDSGKLSDLRLESWSFRYPLPLHSSSDYELDPRQSLPMPLRDGVTRTTVCGFAFPRKLRLKRQDASENISEFYWTSSS